MKMSVEQLAEKFKTLLGDLSQDVPDTFVINAVNWAFSDLPLVPQLGKIFSKHYQSTLDAKNHWRWKLNRDFRRLGDIPMLNFLSSTGGEPCPMKICYREPEVFFTKNGIINLKKPGIPCEYTIEQENDDIYLVFDRPLDIPVIIDYIAYGFPKPVEKMNDTIDISAIAERLIISVMKTVWYHEADDFAFAGAIYDYLDSKALPEAIQMLNKNYGSSGPRILGEA